MKAVDWHTVGVQDPALVVDGEAAHCIGDAGAKFDCMKGRRLDWVRGDYIGGPDWLKVFQCSAFERPIIVRNRFC